MNLTVSSQSSSVGNTLSLPLSPSTILNFSLLPPVFVDCVVEEVAVLLLVVVSFDVKS